jgi:hypothetical protein
VAVSYEAWKRELESPERIDEWFLSGFVAELLDAGGTLGPGEVYSPTIPEIIGGKRSVENCTPSHWLVHLHVLGQIHRQVKDLPEGTTITRIRVDRW